MRKLISETMQIGIESGFGSRICWEGCSRDDGDVRVGTVVVSELISVDLWELR